MKAQRSCNLSYEMEEKEEEEEEEEIKSEEFKAKNEVDINNQATSQVLAKIRQNRNRRFKLSLLLFLTNWLNPK